MKSKLEMIDYVVDKLGYALQQPRYRSLVESLISHLNESDMKKINSKLEAYSVGGEND